MDLAKEFGTDPDKEDRGVWHVIRGGKFLLRRINNPEWRKRVFKQARQSRGRRRSEEQDDLTIDLLTNTVVLDWDSDPESPTCVMERGKPLPFSKVECKNVLIKFPDLMDEIVERASDIEAYQSELDEEIEKNSETS
jgi:hypothetical protein